MDYLGVVLAGCAPGAPDCAAGTVPNGVDTWFIILVLLLLVAVVGGSALFVRHRIAHRPETASAAPESTARA